MKKLIQFSFFMLAAVLMTACSKDSDPTPDPTPVVSDKVTITTQPTTAIDVNGGTATATFTANSAWTATVSSTASSWCSVSPASGTAGTGTITITAAQNTTYDERNAAITIKSGTATQTITVTQKQMDALTVTSNKVEVAAEGGEAKIEVKANVTYSYEIASDATWIKKAAATKALSTTTIALQIDENSSTTAREGKVTITSGALKEEVTIYQAGAKPSIVLTSKDYTIGSDGGNIKVELKSNVTYTYSIIEGKEWISEATTKAMSDYTHTFTVAANTTYDNREGKVVFQSKENNLTDTIKITQAQKGAIVIAKEQYDIEAAGGTIEISYQTNLDCKTTINAEWITSTTTKALKEYKQSFTISPNQTSEQRIGEITITDGNDSQVIKVVQSGRNPTAILTGTGMEINDAMNILGSNTDIEKCITKIKVSTGDFTTTENVLATKEGSAPVYLKYHSGILTFITQADKIILGNPNASWMFSKLSVVETIDLSKFSTKNVTNMSSMFFECSVDSLDLSSFDTSNVTTMEDLLSNCKKLKSVNLKGFNTSNVTNMLGLFAGCRSLTSLDLSSFNTSKVTTMSLMFCGCTSLNNLDINHFDTRNVISMSAMFKFNDTWTTLNIGKLETPKLQNAKDLFSDCKKLELLDLSNFDMTKVTSKEDMCHNLSEETTKIKILCTKLTQSKMLESDAQFHYNYLADWTIVE